MALGALGAWFAIRYSETRHAIDEDLDMVGVAVAAAVLLLLPVFDDEANVIAGVAGSLGRRPGGPRGRGPSTIRIAADRGELPEKFTQMSAELHRYAVEHSDGPDELLQRLAEETEREAGDMSIMLTAPEQATMMTLLARAIGARRALELGTFTGYGSIAIARGLRGRRPAGHL